MKPFFIIALLIIFSAAQSQKLSQVTFSGASTLSHFSLRTDQDVLIRISDDGKLMEWGSEVKALRSEYYAPKLQPFMGRVDYYGQETDSAFRGKVKGIGTTIITYYGSFEEPTRVGKIRSIGSASLDYYSHFENASVRGKLRTIGNHVFEYYSSFENEAFRGNLKSINNNRIVYFSSFDDRMLRGKIKSIGSVNYDWYSSLDRPGMGGSLKNGIYRRDIGGVTYILR